MDDYSVQLQMNVATKPGFSVGCLKKLSICQKYGGTCESGVDVRIPVGPFHNSMLLLLFSFHLRHVHRRMVEGDSLLEVRICLYSWRSFLLLNRVIAVW